MILYKNKAFKDWSSGYDNAYSAEPEHFKHDWINKTLIDLFNTKSLIEIESCLDVGCGQGELLQYLWANFRTDKNSNSGKSFIGVDISGVAIQQCEDKFKHLSWAQDSIQEFLKSEFASDVFPTGIDLIINKAGITKVNSENEYSELISLIYKNLSKNGSFLFSLSKNFYKKWISSNTLGWSKDPIQIIFDIFGQPLRVPSESKFLFIFSKVPDLHNVKSFPSEVEFEFHESRTKSIPIYFDHDLRDRVEISLSNESTAIPKDSLLASELNFNFGAEKLNLSGQLSKKIGSNTKFTLVNKPIRSSRSLTNRISEFCLEKHESVFLGGSFKDWLYDSESQQTFIDIDEFEARVNWALKFLRKHQPGKIIFALGFPIGEEALKSGMISSETAAQPFAEITEKICRNLDINFVNLNCIRTKTGANVRDLSLRRRVFSFFNLKKEAKAPPNIRFDRKQIVDRLISLSKEELR
jgi:SAM-dependent methyltransferase